jgi:hypothetical protein
MYKMFYTCGAYKFEHVMIRINDDFAIFAARMVCIRLLLLHLHGNKRMVSHIEHQHDNQFLLTWNGKLGLESETCFLLSTLSGWFFFSFIFCLFLDNFFSSRRESFYTRKKFIYFFCWVYVCIVICCIYTDNGAIMPVALYMFMACHSFI